MTSNYPVTRFSRQVNAHELDRELPVNPYAPPRSSGQATMDAPSISTVDQDFKPTIGPTIVLATAALLACFLGYLIVYSPPDRRPSMVLSTMVPGLAGYAWTLRFRTRSNLRMLAIVIALCAVVYFCLAYQPGIDRQALQVLFIGLSIPVLLGGGWTWIKYRRQDEPR